MGSITFANALPLNVSNQDVQVNLPECREVNGDEFGGGHKAHPGVCRLCGQLQGAQQSLRGRNPLKRELLV